MFIETVPHPTTKLQWSGMVRGIRGGAKEWVCLAGKLMGSKLFIIHLSDP